MMQKIPTMYPRDETKRGHPVMPGVKPECAWVQAGEGIATRKLDGTNVKVENGTLYKRQKPKEGEYDNASYVQVDPDDASNKWILEAFGRREYEDGIYEAVGPKIQGNNEASPAHTLFRVVPPEDFLTLVDHAGLPRTFEGLRVFLDRVEIEGIVFHHPDGRLAKIKRRDFGLSWPVRRGEP